MFIREGYIASKAQQVETGKMQPDENDFCKKSQRNPQFQTLDEQLESKEKKIHSGRCLFFFNIKKKTTNTCSSIDSTVGTFDMYLT